MNPANFFIRLFDALVGALIAAIVLAGGLYGLFKIQDYGFDIDPWVLGPIGAVLGAIIGILVAAAIMGPLLLLLDIRETLHSLDAKMGQQVSQGGSAEEQQGRGGARS